MRLLHIGQRKTGSTWLQAGAGQAAEAGVLNYCHEAILTASRGVDRKAANKAIYDVVVAALPKTTALPVFASLETLITLNQKLLAVAVKQAWPDAKILVTTRAPLGYLRSSYNNHAINGGTGGARQFANRFRRHMLLSHNLDATAKIWTDTLGPDRITFLPFELLRGNQAAYVDFVSDLLGVKLADHMPKEARHPSPPPRFLTMLREVNGLLEEEAPDILRNKAWIRFVKTAIAGVAHSSSIVMPITNASDTERGADRLPDLPSGFLQQLATRMTILRSLPLYAPYLAEYGLEGQS